MLFQDYTKQSPVKHGAADALDADSHLFGVVVTVSRFLLEDAHDDTFPLSEVRRELDLYFYPLADTAQAGATAKAYKPKPVSRW